MKAVPGFLGYFADKQGNVYSKRSRKQDGKLRKLKQSRSGRYLNVGLWRGKRSYWKAGGSKVTHIRVHTIILETFVGPSPDSNHEARHLNGNGIDNCLKNLTWGTALENAADKRSHNTDPRGERHGSSKLTESQVVKIRKLAAKGCTHVDLAKKFKVSRPHVTKIVNGKIWRHIL